MKSPTGGPGRAGTRWPVGRPAAGGTAGLARVASAVKVRRRLAAPLQPSARAPGLGAKTVPKISDPHSH